MGILTEQFDAVLTALGENERRSARRAGEFIDTMSRGLSNLREPAPRPALPPAIPSGDAAAFESCGMSELRDLAKRFKVPGRTTFAKHIKGRAKEQTAERKRLLVALLVEHGVPALTYENLLRFYLEATGM